VETMATWCCVSVPIKPVLAIACCLRYNCVSARSSYTLQRALPPAGRGVAEARLKAGPKARSGLGSVAAGALRFLHSCSVTQVLSDSHVCMSVRR
jgi:hypothetical protein